MLLVRFAPPDASWSGKGKPRQMREPDETKTFNSGIQIIPLLVCRGSYTMAVSERYVDNHLRSIQVSIMGKSDEARKGAYMVVRGLIRFIRGLQREGQTYDEVMELLERLSKELRIVK